MLICNWGLGNADIIATLKLLTVVIIKCLVGIIARKRLKDGVVPERVLDGDLHTIINPTTVIACDVNKI